MLLILTSDTDFTADFLIVELFKRQLPYFRLNAEELATAGYSFSLDDRVVRKEISVEPKVLNLDDITSVWYRRAIHPSVLARVSPEERIFVAGELRHLAMGLVLNPKIHWVNPIDRVSVAEHKLYQLQIARDLGLRVPRTLVSSNTEKLRDFTASNGGGTICKPIFHGLFANNKARYSVYTRRVIPESFDVDSGVDCPVFLQEEIPRVADVRVTFIGDRCFVADIKGDTPVVDWRDPEVPVRYTKSSLAPDIEGRCRAMLQELGLIYGAFDFVRTPGDDLVFLEVNPTGEWAWLEDQLGFPMRDAFIQQFFGRSQ